MTRSNDTAPEVLRLRQHLPKLKGELVDVAQRAGLSPRIVRNVVAGRPIGADAYLALCAVVGLDPRDLTPCKPREPGEFDWRTFGMFVYARRFHGKQILDVRPAAAAIGISPTTLFRAEHCKPVNVANLLAICRHYGMHPDQFVKPVSVGVTRETPHAGARA